MSTIRAARPLVSLDAVVLDTETTGPDATSARIVQIGAVKIVKGRIAGDASFNCLVNPGIPIPPASTKIHHIGDGDVAGAPPFADVYRDFQAFAGDGLIIGHSIGFDLAIIKRECDAAGLPWVKPDSLCTRMLARVARPSLNDFSIEMLANLLGITVSGRHYALGDAKVTAEIFLALIPLLRARQVRTLAEAEASIRGLSQELLALQEAGWEDPIRREDEHDPALARIDSYPYRHRVRDVMSSPPHFVPADMCLEALIATMMEKKISSVFVAAEPHGTGIVTERDALRTIASKGAEGLSVKSGEMMSQPLATVRADAFIYRAIARMGRLNLRHLGVVDEQGRLVGALTSRNLLRLRAGEAVTLGDEIDEAPDPAALAAAWGKVPALAEHLLAEEVDARDIAAVISREICAITRRAAELAENAMREAGQGGPPVPYAVLVLGSGGRGESLLAADQDNAIIFDAPDEEGAEDAWFERFAAHMADTLDAAGIAYCAGGVMARNKAWRHTKRGWYAQVDAWIRRSKPDDLLNVDIFFDLKPVHGTFILADQLRAYAYEKGSTAIDFAKLLAQTASSFKPPLGMFGFQTSPDGRIDLKAGGLLPVVTAARTLSIRHNVVASATPARLQGVRMLGLGGDADLRQLEETHALVLRHILQQQVEDLHAGKPLGNKLSVKRLNRADAAALKNALKPLNHVDTLVQSLLFAKPGQGD